MGIIVPDWLDVEQAQSASTTRESTPRALLKPVVEKVQQYVDKGEELPDNVKQSTLTRLSDDVYRSIADRHGWDKPGQPFLQLPPESKFKTERDPFRSPLVERPVRRPTPAPKTGEPVFPSEEDFNRALKEAADLDKPAFKMAAIERAGVQPLTDFGTAFKEARQQGKTSFEYDGATFTTRYRNEPEAVWRKSVESNLSKMARMEEEGAIENRKLKVDKTYELSPEELQIWNRPEREYRPIDVETLGLLPEPAPAPELTRVPAPVIPEVQPKPQNVVLALEQAGITIDRNQLTPNIGEQIQPVMIQAATTVQDVLKELNLGETIITSGRRHPSEKKGPGTSLHELGYALDFSIRNVPEDMRETVYTELKRRLPEGFSIDRADILAPPKGVINHIHIEYDVPDTKKQLHELRGAV